MKQYYLLLNFTSLTTEYWFGDTDNRKQLLNLRNYGAILPLGTRKPRLKPYETIKEFLRGKL